MDKRKLIYKTINFFASGFCISYIPFVIFKKQNRSNGSGTLGTIIAVIIYLYLIPNYMLLKLLIVFFICFLSIFTSHYAFKESFQKDDPRIVIDEIAGYLIGTVFINKEIKQIIVLFIIFRLFDVLKPFPAKNLERIKHKGLSITLDDIVAGIYGGFITYLIFIMI